MLFDIEHSREFMKLFLTEYGENGCLKLYVICVKQKDVQLLFYSDKLLTKLQLFVII